MTQQKDSLISASEVTSSAGVVATDTREAALLGAQVLARGGNAMDAAAAACLASCILEPEAAGIGGYACCAVILEGASGKVWSLDANSVAPAAARPDMFALAPARKQGRTINEVEYSCRVKNDANLYGPLAVSVPGVMAGIGLMWEKWGRLKWHEIVEPSLALISNGLTFGQAAAAVQARQGVMRNFEATWQYLVPDGKVPGPETPWHPAELEKTLTRIKSAGWHDFYQGELGRAIGNYISESGGALTARDMSRYRPAALQPLTAAFRNGRIYGSNLPNGALSSLQILNMLDSFEAAADDDVVYWHRLGEVLKLAWRDRLLYLGDPEHAEVPVEKLLSPEYAAGRVETLRQFPEYVDPLTPRCPEEPPGGTIQVSAADCEGNLAAATISHGGLFGSCVTVSG
ncbi:MAG: gamma-glutamyltransferase, partial [Acidobacteriota bacterium]